MTLPIEKQVCSRKLAEELRDLGVPQESLFWWVRHFGHWSINIHKEHSICSAYTVSELGMMLKQRSWQRVTAKLSGSDELWQLTACDDWWMFDPDISAKVIIYLIKQGIIKPQKGGEHE